ncbi:uncharacterized protein TNCV_2695401 [Trichonephila clavipes]|nr:uncharacterized protein TNCV_2695401 [Trichonephila clavipes]
MEVDGALSIFLCSVQRCDVRYTKYLGVGDSKAFDNIVKNKPCHSKKFVKCEGYATRYMGNISSQNINRCKPQHGFCPSGLDTWCRYNKAQLENKVYHYKHKLPVAVVEAIRPIFRDLSDPQLLKKCLHGNTQNPNESINNVIWSRVPRKTFVHLETLSFGTYDAIASFNKGNATKLDILKKLNIEPEYYATCCMERLAKERITWARYANLQKSKEVRKVPLGEKKAPFSQMNSLAASVKLTYSASMVDRLTDFCLKVRHEIGVSSIKVMNPPIDTRSSLFVSKSESE